MSLRPSRVQGASLSGDDTLSCPIRFLRQPWSTVAYSYAGESLTTTNACTARHVSAIREGRGCDAARSQNGLFGIQLNAKQLRSGVRFFDRPVVIQVSPSLVVVAHVDEARHHPFEQHYLPQTLRRAFTFSSITTFMEESASKNRSKTGPSSTMRPPSKGFHRLH